MNATNKQKFVALTLILCLVVASSAISFTVYAATQPSFSTIIEAGSNVESASYIVFRDGSTIFAKDGTTGAINCSSPNASQIINNVVDQLSGTEKETVILQGNITLTHSIELQNYTVIAIQGKITLANSADCDMFKIIDCVECEIRGGMIDGNKANNAVGIGINITQVESYVADQAHIIADMLIQNFAGDGLVILGDTRECRVQNVYSGGNDGRGFQFAGGDHKLVNLVAGNNKKYGFDFSSGGNTQGTNLKAFGSGYGGGIESEAIGIQIGTQGIFLTNVQVQDNYKHGIYIANTDNISLSIVHAIDNGLNFAGGAGIILENCTRITISVFFAYNQKDTTTQDYGLFLHISNNYTTISNGQTYTHDNYDILCDYNATDHPTRIVDCWNGTTWISEYP